MSPPFRRILVANRGEIAVRITRAAHELGMESVAVFSDADRTAPHVRAADFAVRLGPAPAQESYLRADAIIDAARATGAEAVHPGYGFLAERAAFAEAVIAAGLAWVGPPPQVIAALGDKLAARRCATEAGVPVVPGTLEAAPVDRRERLAELIRTARSIGFPLLVKASGGGGGRGMRRVESARDLPSALVAASREAAAGFGDATVYLEREISPARHVEVQLLGDVDGRVVAVGERDCSIQRRHQKLVEEAPAPGLATDERRRLHGLAVALGTAAGLQNAATCEFLLDEERRFWFLEVNTRLQVEHPVTELVAGLDIVAEQFCLAAGRPLSAAALAAAEASGSPASHAIEVRLLAEDPSRSFAPTPGPVTRWTMPGGPGIRVDTGLEAGQAVPSEYDPLIAKLIVHAVDRPAALRRLARALEETEVGGIQTTLPFLRHLASHPEFEPEHLSTDWIVGHWDPTAHRRAALRAALVAAGVAALETGSSSGLAAPGSPGRTAGAAWRMSLRGGDGWM